MLSRNAELSIQTWKPCPGGVSSAHLEDAPLPAQKNRQRRLKERFPVAKEGPGITAGRGKERRGRLEGREQRGQRRRTKILSGANTQKESENKRQPLPRLHRKRQWGRWKLKTGTNESQAQGGTSPLTPLPPTMYPKWFLETLPPFIATSSS